MNRRLDGGSQRAEVPAWPVPERGGAKTAVLAYSGGLDTTCIIAWLKEFYDYEEVVAVLCDVGQEFDLEQSQARGYAAGADDVLLVDRREAFAADQVAKALKTNALYEGKYPLVSALSRPVIAQAVAELAQDLGAEAAVHGCTGKGNDQLRFELAFRANYPGVRVIAPLRDKVWTRDEEIEYAISKGIPITVTQDSPFSFDENLFGRSIEAGILEDPWEAPPEEAYLLTSDPNTAPEPTEIVIGFEAGLPVSLDGEAQPLHELICELNRQAGAYGIGRIDMIENRAIGIKSREVYEAPAAMTLIAAHRAIEDLVLTKAELNVKRGIEDTWAKTVYDGLWFSPVREALDAFVDKTQELVTGEVRVQLRPAAAVVNGRRSEFALYAESLASYATGETFPHDAAEGFIRLASLEGELAAVRARSVPV
jgi:argininosuccinate synthase